MAKDKNKPAKKYPPPFSLRLSNEERAELTKLAEGRPLGQFIKDAIFAKGLRPASSRKVPHHDRKQLAKLLGALGKSRIASNINQLAKAANSGSLPVNNEVLESLNESVTAIQWMRDTLIKAMGLKPQSQPESEVNDDPQR